MDVHFAAPQWVHLLWIVLAFVVLLAWLERRGGDALDRFVGVALLPRLLAGPSSGQRAARIVCLGAAGAFLTLALMRPQWGVELVESRRAGTEIMICLDVSRSMLAEDVAPNRLDRAKAEIRDLLELLDGDQVGLIVFAGRATVLSPLTPDFGFLRLALDDAHPHSVTRGGTRLEEPIRKAVDGFGDAGEVSRSILLITDGEDHDSFPLEAAAAAAARGIRILAIGFGAETGTEIPVTDQQTGARTLLKDADGAVVQSRLDGDLLRELALNTSGAYIPAGTGVLDLDSIYRRHIAPLTRGRLEARARTVRNDAFQWAVLLGLLALLGAVISTARAREAGARAIAIAIAVGLSTVSLTSSLPVLAEPPPAEQTPVTGDTGVDEAPTPAMDTGSEDAATEAAVPDDARTAYNQGLAKLESGDADTAARLLEGAREQAGTDGEARFRATYNLGWAEVSAADALIESEPQDALGRLYRAAAWFREALDLRAGHDDARYNLEIVMRRALELADSLAAQDDGDLRDKLNALIQEQRDFLTKLRAGVAAQQAAIDANVTPELRRQFRSLAAAELTVLADAERLSEQAARELEGINAKSDEARTPVEALRAARLEAALAHVHRARERIGQTRTRLRRLQGERAYRRAASALGALQRARDQLLDPIAHIDALLADGMEVAQLTGLKAAFERGTEGLREPMAAPDWLTPKYLTEAQERVESRTGELHLGLESGLAAYDPEAAAGTGEQDPARAAAEAKLVEKLRVATPLIENAQRRFAAATGALSVAEISAALGAQREALEALAAAREQFLELRGLIELVYGEEQTVAQLIAAEDPDAAASDDAEPPTRELIAFGAATHERNVERTVRLDEMIADALVESIEPDEESTSSETAAPSAEDQRQFFEHAHALLRLAQDSMHAAAERFGNITYVEPDQAPAVEALAATRSSIDTALTHLEALRRLFFSVIEHLRETAQRQQSLADDTEAVAALADPNDVDATADKAGPLGHRQERLATTARAISEALRAQASAPPPENAPPGAPAQRPDPERLEQAAELVAQAGATMNDATARLTDEPPVLNEARSAQDAALVALAGAIELLQPDSQDGEQQQQEQEQQGGDRGEQPPEPEEGDGETDLAQLLQGVRDREAQRREERARDGVQRGYEPVEKDW